MRAAAVLACGIAGMLYFVAGISASYSLLFLSEFGILTSAITVSAVAYIGIAALWIVSLIGIFRRKYSWVRLITGTCVLSTAVAILTVFPFSGRDITPEAVGEALILSSLASIVFLHVQRSMFSLAQ